MKRSRTIEISLHIVFWVAWPFFILLQEQNIMIGVFQSHDSNFIIPIVYGTLFNIFISYSIIFIILPYYFNKRKYATGIIVTLGFYIAVCFLEGLADYLILKTVYFPQDSGKALERLGDQIFLASVVLNIPFILLAFIYRITSDWNKNEKIKQQLKEEKLSSELQFLKSQINPHFLFNTLNNLFGIARQIDAIPVATGIAKLSNLMRYMLYDSEVDRVSLKKEVNYIRDYIELQKLRIDSLNNIHVNTNFDRYNTDLKIAPLLLIPFVENAFKHGISIKENSDININLKTNENTVLFNVSNTINKFKKNRNEENSGFGLKNVQKRLDLLYPNNYSLKINDDNVQYNVSLTINTQV